MSSTPRAIWSDAAEDARRRRDAARAASPAASRPQCSDHSENMTSPTSSSPAASRAGASADRRGPGRRRRPGRRVMCAMRRAARRRAGARSPAGRRRTLSGVSERSVGSSDGRVGVDDGHRDVVAERRPRVGLPADDDDAVDAAAEQRLEVVLLADGVAARVAEEDVDLARAERVLGAHEDRDHEPALEVAREQSDGAGAPGEQAAGERVGGERELLGGLDARAAGSRARPRRGR